MNISWRIIFWYTNIEKKFQLSILLKLKRFVQKTKILVNFNHNVKTFFLHFFHFWSDPITCSTKSMTWRLDLNQSNDLIMSLLREFTSNFLLLSSDERLSRHNSLLNGSYHTHTITFFVRICIKLDDFSISIFMNHFNLSTNKDPYNIFIENICIKRLI